MRVQKCGSCSLVVGVGWCCAVLGGVFRDALVMRVEKAHGVFGDVLDSELRTARRLSLIHI